MTFKCDKCGLCCRSLNDFGDLYSDLNDGNGCCKYFDAKTNLCTIYETRPLKCRVDEGYKKFFHSIPYDDYIEMTQKGCTLLKQKFKKI